MVDFDHIESNKSSTCLYCGCKITSDNNSGWEGFTADGKTTQPICVICDAKDRGHSKEGSVCHFYQ